MAHPSPQFNIKIFIQPKLQAWILYCPHTNNVFLYICWSTQTLSITYDNRYSEGKEKRPTAHHKLSYKEPKACDGKHEIDIGQREMGLQRKVRSAVVLAQLEVMCLVQ